MHDERLERTTNGTGYVWDYTWAELAKLDAGSWFTRKIVEKRLYYADNPTKIVPPLPEEDFSGTPVPRLEEVLEWAKAVKMPVAIELKAPMPLYLGLEVYHDLLEQVLEIVARYGDEEMTEIHSFDHQLCLRVKDLNPNIATNVSMIGAILVDPLHMVKIAKANGISIGSMYVTTDLIEQYHAEDIFVFAWGVGEDPYNEEAVLATLIRLGVDFVSGGYPDLLREVVNRHT
jgi:glycerophosphoryl diester phosphodiesterase